MIRHSIIIPHRARLSFLRRCVESIAASSPAVDRAGVEVLIPHAGELYDGPALLIGQRWAARFIPDGGHPEIFNKPRLLNLGLAAAQGDLITFLDCDMLVGPRFLEAVATVDWARVHRLCYSVHYLTRPVSAAVLAGTADVPALFARYDEFRRGYLARGDEANSEALRALPDAPVWGNSQYTIPRAVLGDLRFDERYAGHGFEDLEFLKRLRLRLGKSYTFAINEDPALNLLHIWHHHERAWKRRDLTMANLARYKAI